MDIGIVGPGRMGSAIASALQDNGHRVGCALDGRSETTRAQARALGLVDHGSLGDLAAASELIFSACSPHAAVEVAHQMPRLQGVFVDANPVSPQVAQEIAELVRSAGGTYVDAAILGRAPRRADGLRLYVSGDRAAEIAALFDQTRVGAEVIVGGPYAASGLNTLVLLSQHGAGALLLTLSAALGALGLPDTLPLDAADLSAQLRHVQAEHPELLAQAAVALTGVDGRDVESPPSLTPPSAPLDQAASSFNLVKSLRRAADTTTLPQLLSSWNIRLSAGEAVRWFGPCTTPKKSGYVVVTDRRLWLLRETDSDVALEEHALDTIVEADERSRRLRVRAEGWEVELRRVGESRSFAELASLLRPVTGTDGS